MVLVAVGVGRTILAGVEEGRGGESYISSFIAFGLRFSFSSSILESASFQQMPRKLTRLFI